MRADSTSRADSDKTIPQREPILPPTENTISVPPVYMEQDIIRKKSESDSDKVSSKLEPMLPISHRYLSLVYPPRQTWTDCVVYFVRILQSCGGKHLYKLYVCRYIFLYLSLWNSFVSSVCCSLHHWSTFHS